MKLLETGKLLAIATLLSACGPGQLLDADTRQTPLAGPYYLLTDYEGYSRVQYGRGWLRAAPLLVGPAVDSVGEAATYLVVCEGDDEAPRRYYLLPLAARSATQATASRLGPFSAADYRLKSKELFGAARPRLAPAPR